MRILLGKVACGSNAKGKGGGKGRRESLVRESGEGLERASKMEFRL